MKRGDLATRVVRSSRRGLLRGIALLVVFALGFITTPDIFSTQSLRSMLLLGSFLGVAAIGQTLCALLGGMDLSIAFVIGASDLGLLWLLDKGFSESLAIVVIAVVCAGFGSLNGLISHRLSGQSVIVSLGIGYVVLGGTQAITSIGSTSGGAVFGKVPSWLISATSIRSSTFGLPISPVVIVWVVLTVGISYWLRHMWLGRGIYALGGNAVAASRLLVPGRRIWVIVFALSGLMAGITGVLLLGFSGGAVADVGSPYLFTTVAAVAIGGTSLAGGSGGIWSTVVGVVILTVLGVILVGTNFSAPAQQVVLGLLIVPAVAIYGRAPHPRMRV